ncbi:hypothetical protein TNCV_1696281 [Trichonephila clavipes]|nr:hypothetical protein TNCV_1696281 [Trichonephila clavipes]
MQQLPQIQTTHSKVVPNFSQPRRVIRSRDEPSGFSAVSRPSISWKLRQGAGDCFGLSFSLSLLGFLAACCGWLIVLIFGAGGWYGCEGLDRPVLIEIDRSVERCD